MVLLTIRDISRQFDSDPVFMNVNFDVRAGDKIGLVGPNGTGKTTLLNILSGIEQPDHGTVEQPQTTDVALLQQEVNFQKGQTLFDEAKMGLAHLYRLQSEATELAERIASEMNADNVRRLNKHYDQLQHELHRLDAYNIDHRVDEVLQGLGFNQDDYDRLLEHFSGGQQNRVLLARLLLRAPDILLLDEPTNHLDIAATEWLEDYLNRSTHAIILVTHDRYFLDRVTNRILELYDGTVTDYCGSFSAYWKQRQERNKVLQRTYKKQQAFIAKTRDFIRRNKYGQKHAQAADREKKLERLEHMELPRQISVPPMSFGQPNRTGDWVIEAVNVSKDFGVGTPLFTDFSHRIHRGERVAVIGPNGSGKTTLLRTLIGDLKPDTGSVRLGTGVEVAYFDQQLESVNPEMDAVEAVRPSGELSMTPAVIRDLLARFGLYGDIVFQKVGRMSGGEKNKVALARLAALNANLLVLDEPTNHLDLWARASLEVAMKSFAGTLLFVSHDRYFINHVATHVIVLKASRWQFYEGNYSDYLKFVDNQLRENSKTDSGTTSSTSEHSDAVGPNRTQYPLRKRKFPYRKVNDLEAEVAQKEKLLEKLQAQLTDPETHRNGQCVKETLTAFEETKSELETLYEHWEEAFELN